MASLKTIFIVDDNQRCIEILSLALKAEGSVDVEGETVPARALARIRKERPGLVLLDVKMPELDGFEMLAQLREAGRQAPVVLLSGSARQRDVDRAYELGCSGYMQKPNTLAEYRELAAAIVGYWRRNELAAD